MSARTVWHTVGLWCTCKYPRNICAKCSHVIPQGKPMYMLFDKRYCRECGTIEYEHEQNYQKEAR